MLGEERNPIESCHHKNWGKLCPARLWTSAYEDESLGERQEGREGIKRNTMGWDGMGEDEDR